jgi:hypothetical protein
MRLNGQPAQTLLIVHLSSLDAYANYCGRAAGRELAERIVDAAYRARRRGDRVYVIDQFWRGSLRDAAAARLRDLGATFIRFDEHTSSWKWFLPRLAGKLRRDGVSEVTLGGVWYSPRHDTGCVTEVYLYLRERMPVTVDEDLVGCEADCNDDDDDDDD